MNGQSATPCGLFNPRRPIPIYVPAPSPASRERQTCAFRDFVHCLRFSPSRRRVALVASVADARPRSSAGSRGSQTYSAPPSTATAPTAQPMERSMTQPGQPGSTARAAATAPNAGGRRLLQPAGLHGRSVRRLPRRRPARHADRQRSHRRPRRRLASMLGLLLQIGIIALIGYLVWTWWQRRSQPALASGPADARRCLRNGSRPAFGLGGLGGGLRRRQRRAGARGRHRRGRPHAGRLQHVRAVCSATCRPRTARKTSARCARA